MNSVPIFPSTLLNKLHEFGPDLIQLFTQNKVSAKLIPNVRDLALPPDFTAAVEWHKFVNSLFVSLGRVVHDPYHPHPVPHPTPDGNLPDLDVLYPKFEHLLKAIKFPQGGDRLSAVSAATKASATPSLYTLDVSDETVNELLNKIHLIGFGDSGGLGS